MSENNKPPLFTPKSLRIFTKIVAIYAAFVILTVIAKAISEPLSDNPMAPSNGYMPLYFFASIHLVLGLINLAVILSNKYNWFTVSASALIMLFSRIYYEDIALWVWSWS